jgi:hypothetical protein
MFETERERQDKEAIAVLKSVVEYLDDTRDEASRLNRLEISPFAEKAAEIMFKGLDDIKNQLIDLAKLHKFNVLSTEIKRSMSSAPNRNSVY